MKITIGRDHATNILTYTVAGQKPIVVKGARVGNSVSGQHCQLDIDENGAIVVTNLKQQNTTWVNGMPVASMHINDGVRIELGFERWPIDWTIVHELVKKAMPKVCDISRLETVWEQYSERLASLQRAQTMVGVYRGVIPVLTIGGGAICGMYAKSHPESHIADVQYLVMALAGVLMVLCVFKSFVDAKRIPEKRKKLQKDLITTYCCPECGYFFGYQDYSVIRTNSQGACPKCKTKLKF